MFSQVTPRELAQWLNESQQPLLLDVRQAEEHQFVSLPGSVLIPLDVLRDRAEELTDWQERDVVVYCHHGVRSLHAIGELSAMGFQKLHNLTGGIDRWSLEVDAALPRY